MGDIETHIPGASGDYVTLCGLDGDDPHESVQQHIVEAGPVVDCHQCKAIWAMARKIKPRQIAP